MAAELQHGGDGGAAGAGDGSAGAGGGPGGGDRGVDYDVVVVGAGPAGLSATLNLVRQRWRTLVVDSNRPRNAATLHSHGFLTRDGVSPLELRRLGREEIEGYAEGEVQIGAVEAVTVFGAVTDLRALQGRDPDGTDADASEIPAGSDAGSRAERDADSNAGPDADFSARFGVVVRGLRGSPDRTVRARVVVAASGLSETFPAIPSLRAHYGTNLHSCIECDGYEKSHEPLALIGESRDLAERAVLLSRFSDDLVVFTNGADVLSEAEQTMLAGRGIRVERRAIDDLVGEKAALTGVRLADGDIVPVTAGFVRPAWSPALGYLDGLPVDRDAHGFLVTDAAGRTSLAGLYGAGETSAPGAQQLIVAAGLGARVATTVTRELLGLAPSGAGLDEPVP
ncbi:NAD(P)/FAD-dependent oxidoreductase [Compostimonas suwonensis]|uniref:Pyridine nucleotide-disulfide oxidoreductase n=1 Tax=Compostimonas suwonensis TaxID=1048394 RepID=A0A2M9BBB7_9MICO|nr:NAD(P)/FAD-dependent oxidoreductase [Compostimonas suwonensis]PJJ55242.1 pyridine nucleotide-disulfide oxidoreductase [Compostimonas suwonensis]